MTGRGVAVTAAVAAWLTLVPAAHAGRVVVADLYGEPDVAEHAQATTLLLRSMLARAGVVPRAELERGLHAVRGAPGRGGLAVSLADVPELARALGADFVVVGRVARDGPGLWAELRVVAADGSVAGYAAVRAGDGDVTGLALAAARALAAPLRTDVLDVPAAALGQLRPFAIAADRLSAGRLDDAGRALAAADLVTAGRVPAAREIAEAVWSRPEAGAEARLTAALVAADPQRAIALADEYLAAGKELEVARGARARALLASLNVDGAERELALVRRSRHPMVALARAELAHRRGDDKARDAALVPLVSSFPPYRPALAFAATLPPGALGAGREERLLRSSHDGWYDSRFESVLGLRAARAGVERDAALALIRVADLDDTELSLLEPLVAGAIEEGGAVAVTGLVLRAERAMRAADYDAALVDVRRALELQPEHERARLYLARLLTRAGDHTGAAAAYAELPRAQVVLEHARSLRRAGDDDGARRVLAAVDDDRSAEALRARAAALLAEGKPEQAVRLLQAALALDPTDVDTQRALVRGYEASGSTARASEANARARDLEASVVVERVDGDGPPGRAEPTRARAVDLAEQAAAAKLADELPSLLDALPALRGPVQRVVLVPLEGSRQPFYSPRQVRPGRLAAGLQRALAAPPYELDAVIADHVRPLPQPLARTALAELAAEYEAEVVLAYGLRVIDGEAGVTLVSFDASTHEAMEARRAFDGGRLGLVEWNRVFFGILGALAALVLAWLGYVVVRGTGEVAVRIKLDSAAESELLTLRVARGPRVPGFDPGDYRARHSRGGHRVRRFEVNLAGPVTRFRRIPPGRWYVHLYGTFAKDGVQRVVADELGEQVREVVVRRNATAHATFDLVPTDTELRVSVFDGDDPVAGARVVRDGGGEARATNADGELVLRVPVGSHVLRIRAAELELSKRVQIRDTKLHTLTVNLQRERRLAEVSDGLTLEAAEEGATSAAMEPDGHDRTLAIGSRPPTGVGAAPAAVDRTDMVVGLARYARTGELGRGAMGVVYRATDRVLERDVALKILGEEMRTHPQAMELFLREAKALAKLNHPNIVTVYDQGFDAGEAYMVMELIDGRTLEQLMEANDRLSLQRACELGAQLCAGLAYAHGQRVIHRDIKPANIFVTADGRVKLGDFGLARVVHALKIQRTEIRGTPLYMAPEQILGTDIDFRADLYAVGCTLFELVAGRPPFVDGEILYHHMHRAPPRVSELVAGVPEELEALIMSCIAKKAEQRPRSAEVIVEALKRISPRP